MVKEMLGEGSDHSIKERLGQPCGIGSKDASVSVLITGNVMLLPS